MGNSLEEIKHEDMPGYFHYTVIIPVYNEQVVIHKTLAHLSNLVPSGRSEILVVDGSADGSTIRSITGQAVTGIISSKGRALQMNAGAQEAKGDILLFLHADTFLPEGSFEMIDNCFADQRYVAGAFSLSISSRRFVYRIIEGVASVRTRLSRIPYGDQAIFIRKDYFDKIGRYRDIPLMEDVDLMRRIRARGDRIVLLQLRVRTSSRRWESEGIVYCTLRNWFLRLLYSMGVPPEKLVGFYR